jgi:hypothetical protein
MHSKSYATPRLRAGDKLTSAHCTNVNNAWLTNGYKRLSPREIQYLVSNVTNPLGRRLCGLQSWSGCQLEKRKRHCVPPGIKPIYLSHTAHTIRMLYMAVNDFNLLLWHTSLFWDVTECRFVVQF